MPSGKVHALATVAAGGISGPALVFLAGLPIIQAVTFAAGCLAGLVLTPDLDVQHNVHADRVMRQSGGTLLGIVWGTLWWPYARLIPHRSPLSHWPILGTALRLAYLLAVPALLWWGVNQIYPLPRLSRPHLTPLWWWALGGLVLVDALHAVMDWISR